MTDELEKLKAELKAVEVPAPRKSARDMAISAAMQAFEEEKTTARQGSGLAARLMNTGNAVFNKLFGRRDMTTSTFNLRPVMLGGVSLAALSLAILNADTLRHLVPGTAPAEQHVAVVVPEDSDQAGSGAATQGSRQGDVATRPAGEPELRRNIDTTLQDSLKDRKTVGNETNRPDILSFEGKKPMIAAESGSNDGRVAGRASSAMQADGLLATAPSAKLAGERVSPVVIAQDASPAYYGEEGRDKFSEITDNPVKVVTADPVSTFSIDVDTASYSFVRASLNNGVLPQANAVRTEELINYFPYDYAPPEDASVPFATHVSVMPTPWNTGTKLMRIGLKGYEIPAVDKPRANLVFLIDTSGSMNAPSKLPLLVNSFKLLLESLNPQDTVSIVTYAGQAGTVLEPTKASDKAKILASLDRLRSGGSTAGGEGIRQAYQLAEQNRLSDGVNRVILATDGDFNVGITDQNELKSFIERKRKTGVSLSVLGFGRGNYNDALMQALAQNGNGNAAYIDTLSEARKVLVEEAGSTLFTIAKDVKIQVEFNPATVSEYRLIGYETRLLNREDFNNDKVDAGEIGAGHSVTAIYELTPVGSKAAMVDGLRYQKTPQTSAVTGPDDEYAYLKLRYKLPDSETSKLISTAIGVAQENAKIDEASQDTRFAAAVAAFGQILRGGRYTGSYSYDDVINLGLSGRGTDEFGYRAEFINLVRLAKGAAAMQRSRQ